MVRATGRGREGAASCDVGFPGPLSRIPGARSVQREEIASEWSEDERLAWRKRPASLRPATARGTSGADRSCVRGGVGAGLHFVLSLRAACHYVAWFAWELARRRERSFSSADGQPMDAAPELRRCARGGRCVRYGAEGELQTNFDYGRRARTFIKCICSARCRLPRPGGDTINAFALIDAITLILDTTIPT